MDGSSNVDPSRRARGGDGVFGRGIMKSLFSPAYYTKHPHDIARTVADGERRGISRDESADGGDFL